MSDPVIIEIEVPDLPDFVEVGLEGLVGERGPQGESEGATVLEASEPISGHHVVAWDGTGLAKVADPSVVSDGWLVLGVSTNAASLGGDVSVQKSGLLTDSSFAFTPAAPIFLGPAGVLTNTPPSLAGGSVFSLRMGTALESDTINISIGTPIALT